MFLFAVLAVFWVVAFAMSKLFTRYGSPISAQVAQVPTAAPAETVEPVVDLESAPTWSELDDRQLTRLLKSAAP